MEHTETVLAFVFQEDVKINNSDFFCIFIIKSIDFLSRITEKTHSCYSSSYVFFNIARVVSSSDSYIFRLPWSSKMT